jgi:hypothetical protein
MQQLPTGNRKEEPTSPPPRPLPPTSFLPPDPALILSKIIRKLSRATKSIYRNRDSQLVFGINRERKPRQTSPNCRRKARSQRSARSLIPLTERPGFRRKQVSSQTRKEPK